MSDNSVDSNSKAQDEKLGAYLRRSRLAAKIELSDLARKIRISPEVLQHIEDSNWEYFSVEAYVRGYLNSICIHLELDRNKVLEWFSSEYRSDYAMPMATLRDMGQMQGHVSHSSSSKLIPILIVLLIVAFFVVMSILRNTDEEPLPITPQSIDSTMVEDSLADSLQTADSSLVIDSTTIVDSTVSSPADKPAEEPQPEAKETSVKLECVRDSVWVRVKRTGEKTRTYQIKEGSPRYVSHTDTIQVRIAGPERTRLYIDNKRVRFGNNKELTILNGKLIQSEP